MEIREDYLAWFYFDDCDEDNHVNEKDKTSIDYEVEEDERDSDFQFPIW